MVALPYGVNQAAGIPCKLCGTVALRRIEDVDEVVRRLRAFSQRRLGGSDVHAPVDQGGVHIDDFHGCLPMLTRVLSQLQGCGRFAAGRRASQGNQRKRSGLHRECL